jgi:hypothetical protein
VTDGQVGTQVDESQEPAIGYRRWAVHENRVISPQLTMSVTWTQTMHAYCWAPLALRNGGKEKTEARTTPHRAPHRDCECGLYAWHNPQLHGAVVGAVQAWGRIMIHKKGFRAEHMRVICLADQEPPEGVIPIAGSSLWRDRHGVLLGPWRDRVKRAARHLKVPLIPMDEMQSYAQEHGRIL